MLSVVSFSLLLILGWEGDNEVDTNNKIMVTGRKDKANKGSQIHSDGGRLDFRWWAHNGVYRCHIIKIYT